MAKRSKFSDLSSDARQALNIRPNTVPSFHVSNAERSRQQKSSTSAKLARSDMTRFE